MTASHGQSRARVAAGLESGAIVFTNGTEDAAFAEGLDSPLIAFTLGGTLVASSKSEVRVYQFIDQKPHHRHSFPGMNVEFARGIAMLPTPRIDEIAVIRPDGLVQIIDPTDR